MISRYPLDQSPLYMMHSKKRLAQLLGVDQAWMRKASQNTNFEYVRFKKVVKGKEREITKPVGIRDSLHKRVALFLERIEPPAFLFSGYKSRSHVDNALCHKGNSHVVTMDISKFYDSSSDYWIMQLFLDRFKMSLDCAWMLSKILSASGCIPTGSSSSTILAYWCHSDLFLSISDYSKSHGMHFSLFVDDMTFSSQNKFDVEGLISFVKHKLGTHGLKIKSKKTRVSNSDSLRGSAVTGVLLKLNKAMASNKVWKEIRLLGTSEKSNRSKLVGLRGYTHYVHKCSSKVVIKTSALASTN